MIKVYPPHQDITEKPHFRVIETKDLPKWICMGWTTDLEISFGTKNTEVCNALRIEEVGNEETDKDQEEVIESIEQDTPRKRGRPRKI